MECLREIEMKVSTWNNCYRDNWTGLIVPESYSHPAKFSPGLIRRIFKHCFEQGYLQKGSIVVDPFAGIGGGGIFAAPMGLRWIGVELEPRFVDLAKQNFALHAHAWDVMDYPQPVILQGDSRKISSVLQEADLIATSPPFSEPGCQPVGKCPSRPVRSKRKAMGIDDKTEYGWTEGQIGNLKSGDISAIISSPPYAESMEKTGGIDPDKSKHIGGPHSQMNNSDTRYGSSPGQIGRMKAGNIDGVICSPPYAESLQSWEKTVSGGEQFADLARKWNANPDNEGKPGFRPNCALGYNRTSFSGDYGTFSNQIGNTQGDTYWAAVRDVYAECHKILKPGGVIIIVVKSYVKQGRRVPLPMQTLKLLIHLGFEPLERIKAMLVEETVTQGLFGDIKKVTERKSFFRRLHEKKYPNLKINFEEVLMCQRGMK